jgi:autotransporter-associated beta strand protein
MMMVFASGSAQAQRLLGIDVSAWQGEITTTEWATFKRPTNQQVGGVFGDGRDFVFIRSSRGGTTGFYNQSNPGNDSPPGQNTLSQRYDDPYYIQNITRATAAGVYAGSYHFSRPDIIASTLNSGGIPNSGTDEANHFIQMAGPWMRPGYLMPVHDFEAGDGIRTDNQLAQFCLDFSNRIYEVMGIRPAIYVNGNYTANILAQATNPTPSQIAAAYPMLWNARWPNQSNPSAIDVQNGHPKDTYSGFYGPWDDTGITHPWAIWQYASTGHLNGHTSGNIDMNVSQGDIEYLKDFLVPALWVNDDSGEWTEQWANGQNGKNWNSGQPPVAPVQGPGQVARVGPLTLPAQRLPGAAGSGVTSGQHDTVILDRPNANITVTHSSGTHNVRKLFVREALDITGGSLTVNYNPQYAVPLNGSGDPLYPNAMRSGPLSAQFSGAVSLSGASSLSVHTLQVDSTQTFTLGGGTLTLDTINLMPHATTPAAIAMTGDVNFNPLNNSAAVIANGAGEGSSGRIDLNGGNRTLNVGNGSAAADLAINVPIINGGLTKSGGGTLALNSANTYAGDTSVLAGVLSLGSPFLANGADVHLASGALLDLNFGGAPDVIDSLFIDGTSQAVGTWGAVGNASADFQSSFISGTGLLQVSTYVIPPLAGDYNEDGTVDAADFLVWRDNLGSETSLPNDDTSGVGQDDWDRWAANFGQTNGNGAGNLSAVVPEPASVGLIAAACAILCVLRCRPR